MTPKPGTEETSIVDSFGPIEPLEPWVVRKAQLLIAGMHGEHPLRVLLDECGLTPGDVRV